jgi:uncharacterized protein (DUF2235 family)
MAKNIVFCADGTWNGLGHSEGPDIDPDATNVLRLFINLSGDTTPASLRLQDEQEKLTADENSNVLQIAKYLHGVGDSSNAILRLLGGVFGEGFIERIVRGYTFVSRNYEPGDRIYLVGFSRGAYTARALGGMIVKMGLLPQDAATADDGTWDYDTAYKLGVYVWSQYRRQAGKLSTVLGYVEELKAQQIDLTRLVKTPIQAIGVWDTVGSLGIPIDNPGDQEHIDVFEFADRSLSSTVAFGFHALAIDEERQDFQPTLWDDRDGVDQRWFCGAHADVGGGYPPPLEFSSVSLDWMIGRLKTSGVIFLDSYAMPGPFAYGDFHKPYEKEPFSLRPHKPRDIPKGALIHPSVQARLTAYAAYAPPNLAAFMNGRTINAESVIG